MKIRENNIRKPAATSRLLFSLFRIYFTFASISEIFPHFLPSNILFHETLFLFIMSRKFSIYSDNLPYQIFPERRETCTGIYLLDARRKLELVESCKCCNSTLMRTRYYSVRAFLLEERFSVCSRTLRGYLVRELEKQRPGKNHSIRR